jgi:hypothetical protein
MESVLLGGAPDGSIGTLESKTNAVQVMHLEMSNDILDDLLECVRKGKAPQVLFGKNPVCIRLLASKLPYWIMWKHGCLQDED